MTEKNQLKNIPAFIKWSPLLASILLLLFVASSLWLILEYADKERNRDLMNWQSRLAMLAEIRTADIEDWIEKKQQQMRELADNPSLRLFLSQLESRDDTDSSVILAQQAHVRNLLRVSAENFGFGNRANQRKPSHISKNSDYGLAILGADGQLLMSTKGFPDNMERHRDTIQKVFGSARPMPIDIYSSEQGQPVLGYIMPVFHIQQTRKTTPVGAVMLLLDPQNGLYNILQNRQSITRTDETLLVKLTASALQYMSPLRGQYKLFHKLADNEQQLAASFAWHNPGGFAEMKDYRGEDVLVTGRQIKNSSWRLVQKISAAEALAESNQHQRFLLTSFTLFILLVASAFIAIWRHANNLRLQALRHQLETQVALLDAVTDNIRDHIILLDQDFRILFINPIFASALGMDAEELKTRQLSNILGRETADSLQDMVNDPNQNRIIPLQIDQQQHLYHVAYTTLENGEYRGARLFVLHDISELRREQEKRERLARGIIGTLVRAVDLHDPYCADHSERTRQVAMAIGEEMGLSEAQLESLEMAALLANIGKLYVARDILTKMEPLSEDESDQLRRHIDYAVDILSGLSFNGPVVDIVAQKNERLDGSGYPAGLKGEAILLESRILAVANAFVAMASSRAYRPGRELKEVMDILLQQAESQYDRHVVAALFHIAENKSDWQQWKIAKQ